MTTPYELTKTEFMAELRRPLTIYQVDPSALIAEALWQQYDLTAICYAVCEIVSERLESGRGHYRDGEGRLLVTLDEVVRWLMAGELAG